MATETKTERLATIIGADGDNWAAVENFGGYESNTFADEVTLVARALAVHYEQHQPYRGEDGAVIEHDRPYDAPGVFGFDYASDGEGGLSDAILSVSGHDGVSLTQRLDFKALTTDREARHADAALAIAEALDDAYLNLLSRARGAGLLEDTPSGRLRDLAEHEGLAVAYVDRGVFESALGRALTDFEWAQVVPHLADYDEWLDNSGASESISYWVSTVLTDQAQIARSCNECGMNMFTDGGGITHHLAGSDSWSALRIDYDADADHVPFDRDFI